MNDIKIQDKKLKTRIISNNNPCFIIAEIGSNHDGDLDKAKEYIRKAKEIGADAVKFQTIHMEKFISKKIYNGRVINNPTLKNAKFVSLPDKWYKVLFDYALSQKIIPFSAPFDIDSVDMLNKAGTKIYKIASNNITFIRLIKKIAKTKKPILLATGASDYKDVLNAIRIIKDEGNNQIGILQCTSTYSTNFEDVNLNVLKSFKNEFKYPIGLSDHTIGIETAIASVSMGAKIIEKHITFDRKSEGTDHFFALEIDEFRQMVKSIRNIEKALGSYIKIPTITEENRLKIIRRGLYAKKEIRKNELINEEHLIELRPLNENIPSEDIYKVIGKKSPKKFTKYDPILWKYFK